MAEAEPSPSESKPETSSNSVPSLLVGDRSEFLFAELTKTQPELCVSESCGNSLSILKSDDSTFARILPSLAYGTR
jgi:hypothetical protein